MSTNKASVTLVRVRIALFNLVLLACIGSLIRYHFYQPIEGVSLTNLHHAHSHLAFLGWVFMALFILLTHQFLPNKRFFDKSYSYLFYTLQGANFGMLFTFPFTGYGPWSIAFSSLHTICAIIFAIVFVTDIRKENIRRKLPMSSKFIIWGLVFMGISNLAPFAIGPITSMYGKSDAYYFLVNAYLHFQYNGWFTFALLGIVLKFLEKQQIDTNHNKVRYGLMLKLSTIFPVLIMATLSPDSEDIWFYIAMFAAAIQLRGVILLLQFFWLHKIQWSIQPNKWAAHLMIIALSSLLIQHLLQVFGALPQAVDLLINRQVVIAYLHLVFIGFTTFLILSKLIVLDFFRQGKYLQIGLIVFIISFFITEFILISRVYIYESNFILFVLALLQLLGIIFFFSQVRINDKHSNYHTYVG